MNQNASAFKENRVEEVEGIRWKCSKGHWTGWDYEECALCIHNWALKAPNTKYDIKQPHAENNQGES